MTEPTVQPTVQPVVKSNPRMDRRRRMAGFLIGGGLLVETISLFWSHPLAFILFLVVGAGLVALGILFYLSVLMG